MPRRAAAPRYPIIRWIESRPAWQRRVALVVLAVFAAWWAITSAADLVVSYWWYDTVTTAPVWSTRLWAQAWLAVTAGLVTAVLVGSTVLVVLRSTPPEGIQAPWLERYHQRVGPAHRWGAIGIAIYLTWHIAGAATGLWQQWLLFWNADHLGVDVPAVGGDLGYYLFRLPLLTSMSSWIRQLIVACLVLAFIGHLLSGAMPLPGRRKRSAPVVRIHLALLGVALAAAQAFHAIVVARPRLTLDQSDSFVGAGFVQENILAPALWLLAIGALVVGVLLVLSIRTDRWKRTTVAIGAWLAVAALGLALLPAAVQTFVVNPAQAERELDALAHNLDSTNQAYRLDVVEQTSKTYSDGIIDTPTDTQLADIARVPLFDTDQLVSSFQVLQGTTGTRIQDIDLDRYLVNGERRPVLVATRNANQSDLPESGWVQSHLVYTHGDGLVVAPADRTAADGRPDLSGASDLTPVRDQIYFGEGLSDWYAIVGTKRQEQGGSAFDADTGIDLSSTWRRLVVALSFGETEPFLSAELTDQSQLLMTRGLRERLAQLAPFLSFDGNPYPAVAGDRIVWIVDGYTTSSTYPFSQFASHSGLSSDSDLSGQSFNYLHASVKAVVDAYSGEVTLYRTEVGGADDPVLDVWSKVFPGLLRPIAEMPDEIRAHLRYPADLFTVQANLLGRYHVDTAEALFDGTQRWSVSPAVSTGVNVQPDGITSEVSFFSPTGEEHAGDWVALRTFNPGSSLNANSSRDGLAAFAVADHDDFERVTLVDVDSATKRLITSPRVAQSAIDADPDLAREFTFLNSNGSKVSFGPMTMLPLGDAIVWMRPIIVSGTSGSSTPHLYKVIVVSNGVVGQGATAAEALIDATAG